MPRDFLEQADKKASSESSEALLRDILNILQKMEAHLEAYLNKPQQVYIPLEKKSHHKGVIK